MSWKEKLIQIVYNQELKPVNRVIFTNTLEQFIKDIRKKDEEELIN